MLAGLETGVLFKEASNLWGNDGGFYWRVDGWQCCYEEDDGEEKWVWILSAIKELVIGENLRRKVIFCAVNRGILKGE